MQVTGRQDFAVFSGAADGWARDALLVGAMVGLVLSLPPAIYGYLSYRQFDFFRFTYYVPYEEVFAALRSRDVEAILTAPLISANMTSGFLLSTVYALDIQQLVLSVGLGVAIGINLVAFLALRRECPASGLGGGAAAAGSGLFATVAASSTGLVGCCGSALSGGVLALIGVSSTTAAQIAEASPLLQVALIAGFALNYLRLRRRRRRPSIDLARGQRR